MHCYLTLRTELQVRNNNHKNLEKNLIHTQSGDDRIRGDPYSLWTNASFQKISPCLKMNKKDPKHTQGSYENTLQNNGKKKKNHSEALEEQTSKNDLYRTQKKILQYHVMSLVCCYKI